MKKNYRFLATVLVAACCGVATAQNDFWQQTNGPIGATVTEVVIHPADDAIFIAVENEGVHRSTDGGETWVLTSEDLRGETVTALAIHPNGDLYAGTASGVFRSSDSGASWAKVYLGNVQSLAIDPQNGDLFAGLSSRDDGTVVHSSDNGVTWEAFSAGLNDVGTLPSLAVSAATGDLFLATSDSGVFRSTDRGESWHSVNQGITALEIRAVAVHPNGSVFVGTGKDTTFAVHDEYIYRSEDNGETWTRVYNRTFVGVRTFSFNAAGNIFASTRRGVLRSTDDGSTWQEANDGLRSLYVFDLAFDSGGRAVVVTHCTGVFASDNNGGSWAAINGDLKYTSILSLVVKPTTGQVYVGTHCGGVFRSLNDGATWEWAGLQGATVNALAVSPTGKLFAGTSFFDIGAAGDVYRSSDDGVTWRNISPDNDYFLSLAFDPDGRLFAGTGYFQLSGFGFADYGDIYRTADEGDSWARVAEKLDDHVFALAAHPEGRMFAGTREGVYRSFGEFWHKILNQNSRSLLTDPGTGDVFAGTEDGIFRSSDEGESWTHLISWSKNHVFSLARTADGHLYAGTAKEGVLFSDDHGETWTPVNAGLTNMNVQALAVKDGTAKVFAGTLGHGVFLHESGPTPPAAPVLASPGDGAVDQPMTLTLSWHAVTSAQTYHLQVSTSSDFASTVVDEDGLTGTSRQVGPLAENTQHFWRVRAANAAGAGDWSEVRSFTTGSAGTAQRVVWLDDAAGSPGVRVEMSVRLSAQGDENALGFSVAFNPEILTSPEAQLGADAGSAQIIVNDSQASDGRLGVTIALGSGQTFPADTVEVAVLGFTIAENTEAESAAVEFGDQPVTREVSDAAANALEVSWVDGTVTIIRGLEADVAPRPSGNASLTVSDWVQVGRFAAGLDTARTDVNEFQRADCAPRATFGNGSLTVSDWVQAGRYAAGLDEPVPAAGPVAPGTPPPMLAAKTASIAFSGSARTVRAVAEQLVEGQTDTVTIELETEGDENALGFTLTFDPTILQFDTAAVAPGLSNASLIINSQQAGDGRLGLALALQAGQTFPSGAQAIIHVRFRVDANAGGRETTLDFGDTPTAREVSDAQANALDTSWEPLIVTVGVPTAVSDDFETIPTRFALQQNYPNPFNPETTIEFAVPERTHVTLRVFDITGRTVATLVDEPLAPSRYRVVFEAGELPSGVYFYRLEARGGSGPGFVETRKLTLLK